MCIMHKYIQIQKKQDHYILILAFNETIFTWKKHFLTECGLPALG